MPLYMAKRDFADVDHRFGDGEMILDYPDRLQVITWVPLRGRHGEKATWGEKQNL